MFLLKPSPNAIRYGRYKGLVGIAEPTCWGVYVGFAVRGLFTMGILAAADRNHSVELE